MIAALYVERGGVYYGLPGVDPWDEKRDARQYAGPWPVVVHPPCARWGRYWYGNPTMAAQGRRLVKGDDQGCFAAALAAVRRWGGVLEHPEASHAWPLFGLNDPPFDLGHWVAADWEGGWTCCVSQAHYGHRSRKMTWLYAHSVDLPDLVWGPATGIRLEHGYHTAEERRRKKAERGATGARELLSHRQRAATPLPFRDLLLGIAATANQAAAAPGPGGRAGVGQCAEEMR